ncbi:MAG: amidohydrolase [Actinobacteria bacterium]|nr:MAG: amidohydrolase [Actinomycetota bacterium]
MSLVLRNALVVDGSGGEARRVDVTVDGGRIASVGEGPPSPRPGAGAGEEVDLDGLVLAPGFIDIHTHYDAQVLWDPDLTPSCWHGVTTVIMGNCGFGIAPTRPGHRSTIARTLENVEGMSVEALEAGIPWSFETFPEYLDTLDAAPKRLNVGALLGHTPLRLYVLGEEAVEREATEEETERMRDLVAEALEAGAMGFATSRSPTHQGDGGRPVPSRLASTAELFRLASALGEAGRGVVQVTPGPGLFVQELAELAQQLRRPVSWTALLTGFGPRGSATGILQRQSELEGEVWPQVACRPLVMQLTLEDPFPLAQLPSFKEVLATPRARRAGLYADAAWRERARPELGRGWTSRLPTSVVAETERHGPLKGRTLADIAAERGVEPFDVLVDLSLEEDLRTRFRVVLANDDEDEVGDLLRDHRSLLGLSDAGAHASQLCDACFSTHLLGHWVRERKVLSLEEAVWRLTGHPHQAFRIPGRGLLRPGYAADLVAFDPDTVGVTEMERVWDLPAGADRLLARSQGVEHVWVNGVAVRTDGRDDPDARPGVLMRGGDA